MTHEAIGWGPSLVYDRVASQAQNRQRQIKPGLGLGYGGLASVRRLDRRGATMERAEFAADKSGGGQALALALVTGTWSGCGPGLAWMLVLSKTKCLA